MPTIVVRASWDGEADVWVAQSTDLPGLLTEAGTLQLLAAKLPNMIRDLVELPENVSGAEVEVNVEVIASISTRARVRLPKAA
jgi:Domain of unknown function (DUF1902)